MSQVFNINQVENVAITLDNISGLAKTINDLVSEEITLFTEYPQLEKGKNYRANRLADKLMALSSVTITTTEQAQNQLTAAVKNYYQGMSNNDRQQAK